MQGDYKIVISFAGLTIYASSDALGIGSTLIVRSVRQTLPDLIAVLSVAIEITLEDENGDLIQPFAPITFCYDPPYNVEIERMCIARLDEDNEWTCESIDLEASSLGWCGDVDHFSIYALVDFILIKELNPDQNPISAFISTEETYSSFTFSYDRSPITDSFTSFTDTFEPITDIFNSYPGASLSFSTQSDALSLLPSLCLLVSVLLLLF